ncbi:hypothetical protein TNIN_198781 [Trichonephila inaurata madagascariensis]|uniref:Uncharacterized protein n=1 Tax=Trichonephila inaurata madagascariensis TaxID=2747483 RepID=A0A8X6YVF2_9ARAC|nr:hypothetical protein TNIN_14841 [Trichonephila inaurata madagascariensis]GFY78519.1 hypothetical protein TNIN_198781 [Trichonephila inaurata madagascariensis]
MSDVSQLQKGMINVALDFIIDDSALPTCVAGSDCNALLSIFHCQVDMPSFQIRQLQEPQASFVTARPPCGNHI